jgi:hypothetical protein
MIYLLIPVVAIIVGSAVYVKLSADLEVKKDMELKKYWARVDYGDRVINECLSKIESE